MVLVLSEVEQLFPLEGEPTGRFLELCRVPPHCETILPDPAPKLSSSVSIYLWLGGLGKVENQLPAFLKPLSHLDPQDLKMSGVCSMRCLPFLNQIFSLVPYCSFLHGSCQGLPGYQLSLNTDC